MCLGTEPRKADRCSGRPPGALVGGYLLGAVDEQVDEYSDGGPGETFQPAGAAFAVWRLGHAV